MKHCPFCQPESKPTATLQAERAAHAADVATAAGRSTTSAAQSPATAVPSDTRPTHTGVASAQSPETASPAGVLPPSAGVLRRAARSARWLLPAAVLIAMPKCPMCVAAYIALFIGVGVSVSTAQWIQIVILAVCVMSLAYLAFNASRRVANRRLAKRHGPKAIRSA